MLREQSRLINWLQKSFDICITFASFNFAYFVKKDLLAEPFRGLITGPNYQLVILLAVIFWYFSLNFLTYTPPIALNHIAKYRGKSSRQAQ